MRNDNMVHVGRTRTMLLYLRRFQISEAEVAEEIGLKTLGLPAPHGPVVYIPAALAEKIAGAVASIRQSLEEEWCGDCGRRHDRAARLERLRTLLRRGPRDALELRLQMDCAYTDDDTGKRRGIRDLNSLGARYTPTKNGNGTWALAGQADSKPKRARSCRGVAA